MIYLINQTFVLLLIAGLLGFLLGWYLTRKSADERIAALRTRLSSAELEVTRLQVELSSAAGAHERAETECSNLSEELAELRAKQASLDDDNSTALAALQARLDSCHAQLSAARASNEAAARPLTAAAFAPSDDQPQTPTTHVSDEEAPPMLDPATVEADDLQRIKGIGPKLVVVLKDLGVLRFEQIAAWTPENVAWVNEHLRFKGRIEREQWISQAKALLEEGKHS